jgi:hypothetical protein
VEDEAGPGNDAAYSTSSEGARYANLYKYWVTRVYLGNEIKYIKKIIYCWN